MKNFCVDTLTFDAGQNHSSVSCHWGLGVCCCYRQEDWSCAMFHPNGSALLDQSGISSVNVHLNMWTTHPVIDISAHVWLRLYVIITRYRCVFMS